MIRSALISIASLSVLACTPQTTPGTYTGYVEAEYVYVAAPQSGWLETLSIREGDRVSEGALLFALDDDQQEAVLADAAARLDQADAQARDLSTGARPAELRALEAQLAEARARLAQARAERDRSMPLVAEGIESKIRGDQLTADYNAALARVRAAEEALEVAKLAGREGALDAADAAKASAAAGLSEARWRLNQRAVHTSTAGTVETLFHRRGEFVMAGTPVVALLPDNAMKVRFFVPQAELSGIAPGGNVAVEPDGGPPVTATVSYIATEAEFTPPVIYSAGSREKLVFLVEARLPQGTGLRPGLPVDVRVRSGE